jgi:methylglyoxal synthase
MKIVIIAEDGRREETGIWFAKNLCAFLGREIVSTQKTGKMLEDICLNFCYLADGSTIHKQFNSRLPKINLCASEKMGGYAEVASLMVNDEIDMCFVFPDDLSARSNTCELGVLFRQARLKNIPFAFNMATADLFVYHLFSSLGLSAATVKTETEDISE